MKPIHFFGIIGPLIFAFWAYENYRLVERIDTAMRGGEIEYTEVITSRLCLGIRFGFFKPEQPTEFSIFDPNGKLFNEAFSKSVIGGCRRRRPYRATWTKLEP